MATPTELIQQLYVAYYNRPADVAGLTFYVNAYNNGATIDQISKSFNTAAEYTAAYAGKSADAIVNTVYQNLFGRGADSEGLNFWGPKIASGAITTADLVKAITAGALNADGTPNADGLVFNNKVAAAIAFTTEIGTAGNETERVAYANGSAATLAAAKAYIAGVTTDASLAAAQAAVHATAQSIVAGTIPTVNTTLTSGTDNIVGGAGNDVITGTIGDVISGGVLIGAGTLTGLDAIDGGAGSNTLNIVDQVGGTALPGGLNVTNVQTVNVKSVGAVTENFTTGFTGVTALNVTQSSGADVVKAGATTAVNVVNTAGSVTLTGGLTQTVTTAGGYAISGGKGAIVVTDTAQAAVASTIDGGTSVNLTTTTTSNGTVTVGGTTAATGAVNVTENLNGTGALTGGAIKVTGGTAINVTVNATQATKNTTTTAGAVTVTGSTATTTVAVTETKAVAATAKVAGVANNTVDVVDANYGTTTAGTISSVNVSGYTALNIKDSALTTLSVANGSSNIIIDNSDAVTAPVTTLALTANGLTGGTLDDADVYKTLNVTTTGANSTLANITFGAATALTVAGTKVLTLTSAAGLGALKTITVTGSAGLTANAGIAGTVTSIDASATSGNNSVTLNPSVATYKGGSGVDVVTISTAAPTKSITGGAGAADELVLNLAAATLANPSGNAFIGGFEVLGFGGAATGTYNGTGFNTIHFGSAAVAGAVTVNSLAAGTNLLIDAAPGADVTYTLSDATGTSDSVNVTIGAATVASTALAGNNVNLAGIETVKLTALGDGTGTDTVKLVDTAAKALTIAGNSAVTVTLAGATALASVDASASTGLVNVNAVALGTSGATVTSGAGGLTAAAGAGADTFVLTASAAAVDTLKFTDGNAAPVAYDVVKGFVNFATGTVAGDLSDHIVFGNVAALTADVTTATNIPAAVDPQNAIPTNVTYTTKSGIITFGGSGLSAATLPQLIGAAESIVDNAGIDQTLAFQYNGDTFVVHSNHTNAAAVVTPGAHTTLDSVIQLVGVTGITSLDVTGAAAGAHVLLIA